MEMPASSWNFISSSFWRCLSFAHFSRISFIMGWYTAMRALLFCCFIISGNRSTLMMSVNRTMVTP